jgi:hypothetical protein
MRYINILSIFLFVLIGCSTKTVTYYDIDKTQTIGISNRIYADSNLECFGTFSLYSGRNTKLYEGIALELTFLKDSSIRIEELDIRIKPSNNEFFITPVHFSIANILTLEQIEGNSFNAVRTTINQAKDQTVSLLFKDNVEQYDSLYLYVRICFWANDKHYYVRQNKSYVKGYFRKPFSR